MKLTEEQIKKIGRELIMAGLCDNEWDQIALLQYITPCFESLTEGLLTPAEAAAICRKIIREFPAPDIDEKIPIKFVDLVRENMIEFAAEKLEDCAQAIEEREK